jgi:hypothetical protein
MNEWESRTMTTIAIVMKEGGGGDGVRESEIVELPFIMKCMRRIFSR